MAYQWTYHTGWRNDSRSRPKPSDERLLKADDILSKPLEGPESDWTRWLFFADQAYLSCRILLLTSQAMIAEAYYCAAQTLEKYMKTILIKENMKWKFGHCLEKLAQELGKNHPEFHDLEFLELCRRLTVLEESGRYPETKDGSPTKSPPSNAFNLLTFLDCFVHRCRELLNPKPQEGDLYQWIINYVEFEVSKPSIYPLAKPAIRALRKNNLYIAKRMN